MFVYYRHMTIWNNHWINMQIQNEKWRKWYSAVEKNRFQRRTTVSVYSITHTQFVYQKIELLRMTRHQLQHKINLFKIHQAATVTSLSSCSLAQRHSSSSCEMWTRASASCCCCSRRQFSTCWLWFVSASNRSFSSASDFSWHADTLTSQPHQHQHVTLNNTFKLSAHQNSAAPGAASLYISVYTFTLFNFTFKTLRPRLISNIKRYSNHCW